MPHPPQTPGWFDFKRKPGESQDSYEQRMKSTNPFRARELSPSPPGAFDSRKNEGKPDETPFPRTRGAHRSKAK